MRGMREASRGASRHRACRGCGYDLFGLPAEGVCPECGRGIGGGRKRRGAKNPRRAAGQLRRMIVRSQRVAYIVAAFWALPLGGLIACGWFGAPGWVWGLVAVAFVSGIIQHLNEVSRRGDWKERLGEIEGGADGGGE